MGLKLDELDSICSIDSVPPFQKLKLYACFWPTHHLATAEHSLTRVLSDYSESADVRQRNT